jgi:two-component system chemotaxis response regulator CheB
MSASAADARHHAPPGTGNGFDIVVMAASRGGIKAVRRILSGLPRNFPLPVAIVQHRGAAVPNRQPEVLRPYSSLPIDIAAEGDRPACGRIYLAPPGIHLTFAPDGRFHLRDGTRIRNLRCAADPLFMSAARTFGPRVLAVVVTGSDYDATDGVRAVKHAGGTVIAQDEASSEDFSMPGSAIGTGCVDRVLPLGGDRAGNPAPGRAGQRRHSTSPRVVAPAIAGAGAQPAMACQCNSTDRATAHATARPAARNSTKILRRSPEDDGPAPWTNILCAAQSPTGSTGAQYSCICMATGSQLSRWKGPKKRPNGTSAVMKR